MKLKFIALICCILILTCQTVRAAGDIADVAIIIDGIIDYKLKEADAENLRQWIDGELTAGAGTKTSEWLIIGLRQYDAEADFTSWTDALERFLVGNDIAAVASRQRYALALIAGGRRDSPLVSSLSADTVSEGGVMSRIYGLHLLNNGGRAGGASVREVIDELLALRLADGGWALMGQNSDIDITAMAVQALAPHYDDDGIDAAVDAALDLLGEKQLDDGGYRSFGTKNPESPAQVIVALTSLGIDPVRDERFIKNGDTLLDGMLKFRLHDGSFSHTEGGASNQNATTQVFYSLVSLWRMRSELSPLYIFVDQSEQKPQKNRPENGLENGPDEVGPENRLNKSASAEAESAESIISRDGKAVSRIRTAAILLVALVVCLFLRLRKRRG